MNAWESEPREHGCFDPESQFGLSPSSKLMGSRFNAMWRHSMRVGRLFDWLVYDEQKYSLMYWKRLWCWEWLKAGGEGDDRGWDGWRASLTQWTWVWGSSGSWWWTGRPGMLQSMVSQRVGHDWATELNWTDSVMWRNVFWIRQTLENSFTFPGLISRPPNIGDTCFTEQPGEGSGVMCRGAWHMVTNYHCSNSCSFSYPSNICLIVHLLPKMICKGKFGAKIWLFLSGLRWYKRFFCKAENIKRQIQERFFNKVFCFLLKIASSNIQEIPALVSLPFADESLWTVSKVTAELESLPSPQPHCRMKGR